MFRANLNPLYTTLCGSLCGTAPAPPALQTGMLLLQQQAKMPKVGIDPTTKSLKDFRSTTELPRRTGYGIRTHAVNRPRDLKSPSLDQLGQSGTLGTGLEPVTSRLTVVRSAS